MKTQRLSLLTGLILGSLVGAASTAWAHSFPQQESPAAGQTLSSPPSEVTIRYDAKIEKLFAKLEVLDADGKNQAVGKPFYGSDGATLSIKLAPLKPGDYTVKWAVVGADTHRTQGSYTFTIAGHRG
jgi:methionine-rich copper-binding protein CopC